MILLILGLALWCLAHVFRRIAPGARGTLEAQMGKGAKGLLGVALLVALVLIIWGYRAAPFVPVWQPPAAMVHINNLLMLFAVALFGLGHSKSRLRGRLRHPMLSAVVVWGVAHLLVNGDLASIVMFGVLLLWALAEMALISRAEPAPAPYDKGSLAGDIRLVVITLVLFAVIVLIHGWIGPSPLPG